MSLKTDQQRNAEEQTRVGSVQGEYCSETANLYQ